MEIGREEEVTERLYEEEQEIVIPGIEEHEPLPVPPPEDAFKQPDFE